MADLLEILLRMSGDSSGAEEALGRTSSSMKKTEDDANSLGSVLGRAAETVVSVLNNIASAAARVGAAGFSALKSGAETALAGVRTAAESTVGAFHNLETGVTGAAGGIIDKIGGIVKTVGGMAIVAATTAEAYTLNMRVIDRVIGTVEGRLLELPHAATQAAAGIGRAFGDIEKIIRPILQESQATKDFEANFQKLLLALGSPLINGLISAMTKLNVVMADPAVKQFVNQIASVFTVAMQTALRALDAFLAGFENFAQAITHADLIGAIQALGKGIENAFDALTGGAFSWGVNLIVSFANGIIQGAESAVVAAMNYVGALVGDFLESHSPPKRGPLANIDVWGINLITTYAHGFTHADFTALNDVGAIIKSKLEAIAAEAGGNVTANKVGVVRQLIGREGDVAAAIADLDKTGTLTEATVQRLRTALAGLGPAVQDYAEASLRALAVQKEIDAETVKMQAAQADLRTAQETLAAGEEDLNQLQHEQELLRRAQEDRAAALHGLEQQVKDDEAAILALKQQQVAASAALIPLETERIAAQQALDTILVGQEARRQQLRALTEQQADAERDVTALERQQAAALAALLPMKDAITQATLAEHQAELQVQAAQAALAPMQEHLQDLQNAYNATQQQFQQEEAAVAAQLQAVQDEMNGKIQKEQDALSAVKRTLDSQIASEQALIDQVEAKWKSQVDGAKAALDAATALWRAEDDRNNIQLINFDKQKEAANRLADPNERLAALARIAVEEQKYQEKAAPTLDRLDKEKKLREDNLKTITDQRDAEEQGAKDLIAALQEEESKAEKITATRVQAIHDEYDTRIRSLQDEEKSLKSQHATALAIQKAEVDAAQAQVAAQQKVVSGLEAQKQAISDQRQAAEDSYTLAQQEVHDRTDGALKEAQDRAQGIKDQADALQTQLAKESQGARDRLDDATTLYNLKKDQTDLLFQQANEQAQARRDADQQTLSDAQDANQKLTDAENAALDKRLRAAQDTVYAEQQAEKAANAVVQQEQDRLDLLNKQKDVYDAQAQVAKDLVDEESKLAQELSSAEGNTPNAPKAKKPKVGKPEPPPIPALPDPGKALAPWTAALAGFSAQVHAILDPLGAFFDDIFHGRFLAAEGDVQRFGDAAGAAISKAFGPQALDTIRKVTDPLGVVLDHVLKLGDALSKGEAPIQAFKDNLGGLVPAPVAVALGDLWNDISHFVETIGPNLLAFWQKLQPGLRDIIPIASKVSEIFGIILYGGIKLVVGLLQWMSDHLPDLGTLISGVFGFVNDRLGDVTKAIQPLLDAFGQKGLQGVLDALNSKTPTTNTGFELIRNVFQTIQPIAKTVGDVLGVLGTALKTAADAVQPLLTAFGQGGLSGVMALLNSNIPTGNQAFDALRKFLHDAGDAASHAWEFLTKVLDVVKNVAPIVALGATLGPVVGFFAGIVGAVGDLIAVLSLGAGGGLFGILSALVAGGGPLATFAIVLGAIISPVGLIVIAITGLAALFLAWAGGIDGLVERVRNFFTVISNGGNLAQAFTVALNGMIPVELAHKIGEIVNGLGTQLGGVFQTFTTKLLPALKQGWDALQPGLAALGGLFVKLEPVLGVIAAVVGGVLVAAFSLLVGLINGLVTAISYALPFVGQAFGGAFQILAGVIGGVVDIITGLVKLIIDVVTLNFGQAGKDLSDTFTALGDDIGNILSGLGDLIVGAFGAIFTFVLGLISGFVDSVVSFFTGLYDDLVGHSVVPDLVNGIIGFFQGLPGAVLGFLKGLWDQAVTLFTTGASLVTTIVSNFITDRVNAARDFAVNFIVHIIKLKDDAIQHFNTLISTITTNVNNFITERVNAARDFAVNLIVHFIKIRDDAILHFNTLISTITTAVSTFITERVNAARDFAVNLIVHFIKIRDDAILHFNTLISTITTNVSKFITDRVNAAKQFAIDFIVHIIKLKDDAILHFNTLISTITTAVSGFITDRVNAAKQFAIDFVVHIIELKDNAIAKFNELKDAIIGPNGILSKLASGVLNAAGTVVDSLTGQKGVFATMLSKAQAEIPKWITVGVNIVGGIITGIQQKAADLWDTISNLGQQAPKEAGKATQSHSPSKIMIPEGENLIEGMGVGVDNATPGLLGKIAGVGTAAASSLGTAMNAVRTAFGRVFGVGNSPAAGGAPGPAAPGAPATTGGGGGAAGGTLLDMIDSWGAAMPGAIDTALSALPAHVQAALDKIWAVFKNNFWPHPQEVDDKSHNIIFLFLDPSENGFFQHLATIVTTFMETLWFNTWKGELDKLMIRLSDYLSTIKDTGYTAMKSIGVAMGQGFIEGMDSMIAAIAAKAAAMVTAAINAAKAAAGNPQSPAPAFIPLGQTWGEGLNEGLGRMQSVIRTTARNIVGVAQAALNAPGANGFGLSTGNGLTFAGATAGQAAFTTHSSADNRTYNIGAQYFQQNNQASDFAAQEFYRLTG